MADVRHRSRAGAQGRGPIYLPERYDQGFGERWRIFAESRNDAARLGGFVGALLGAMQNWNDAMLARMPGVRDRVARVRLNEHEGGLNLNMEKDLIAAIASRGEAAAGLLLQRFGELPGGQSAPGWDDHRMVRLNVLLNMLEARASGIVSGLSSHVGHATDFRTLFTDAIHRHDSAGQPVPPPGYLAPFTAVDKDMLEHLVEALEHLAQVLMQAPQTNPFYAVPRPELRVRPPL